MRRQIGDCWLRDWREEDAPALARYADNRKIWSSLRDAFPHPYRLEHAGEFIRRVSAAAPRTVFAIATESEAVGSIGLMPGQDVHRYTAELGYWLAEPYWGRGIVTAAVRAMVEYGFAGAGPAPDLRRALRRQRGLGAGAGKGGFHPGGPAAGQRLQGREDPGSAALRDRQHRQRRQVGDGLPADRGGRGQAEQPFRPPPG